MYNISIKNISWKSHSVNLPLQAGLISFDGWICEEVLSEVVDMWQLQDGLLTTNKRYVPPSPFSVYYITMFDCQISTWLVMLHSLWLSTDLSMECTWLFFKIDAYGMIYVSQRLTLHSSLCRSLHKVDLICWKFDADCMLYFKCQPNSLDDSIWFFLLSEILTLK